MTEDEAFCDNLASAIRHGTLGYFGTYRNKPQDYRKNLRPPGCRLSTRGGKGICEEKSMSEYKLVPIEPTEEMLLAAFKQAIATLEVDNSDCKTDAERSAKAVRPLYAAMIAAAPHPQRMEG